MDAAARNIVAEAYEHGSTDNLTVQIVRIDELPQQDAKEVRQKLTELPFPPILQPRMSFDGYRIVREVHASSRSHIYLAVDNDTKASVILKTPSIDLRNDTAYLERFLMEDWVARRINNAHVLKPCEATRLLAFHRLEMLHQDLRPNNIMIDTTGTMKIIDFGSTRVAGIMEIATPIERNNLLGTALYTAPEYFLGESGTTRSDLYSLGIITYQMLSNKLPYGTQVPKSERARRKRN